MFNDGVLSISHPRLLSLFTFDIIHIYITRLLMVVFVDSFDLLLFAYVMFLLPHFFFAFLFYFICQ